jgi:nitrite reductase/ring-hydroxylating ferredoxin subunit
MCPPRPCATCPACLRTRRRAAVTQRPDALYADRGYDHDKYRKQVARLGSSRSSPVAASNMIPGWPCTAGSLSRVSPYCTGSAGSASDGKSATTSTKPSSASLAPSSAGDASTTSQTVRSSKGEPLARREADVLPLVDCPSNSFWSEVLVTMLNGKPRAFINVCMHHGGPLVLEGDHFTCEWHGSQFDPRTGKALSGPVRPDARLIMLPTHVEEGTLLYVYDNKPDDASVVSPTTDVTAGDTRTAAPVDQPTQLRVDGALAERAQSSEGGGSWRHRHQTRLPTRSC